MKRFANKTVLITGGTSGIGLAGAERLASEGARVVVTGRSEAHLKEAADRLGRDVRVLRDDAAEPESPQRLAAIVAELGGLDGLWLNAGYADAVPVTELSREDCEAMFATNVIGPMLQLAGIAPAIRPGGAVLVTSSTAAYEGQATISLYAATKAALLGAARAWASELAPRRIRVNTLVPGPITSNLRSALPADQRDEFEAALAERVLLRRVGDPEEAAALAAFLLSDEASYLTGSSHLVDGGLLLH